MSSAVLSRRELALQRAVPRRGQPVRILISIVLVSFAALAAYSHETMRTLEATASSAVLGLFGYDNYSWRDQVIFRLGDDRFDVLALRITVECTSLVVLVPLLLFAVGVLLVTRVGIGRWTISLIAAVAIVLTANTARIVVIAVSLRELGREGYAWTHTVVGTAIIAVGTIIAVTTMLAIQFRRRERRNG